MFRFFLMTILVFNTGSFDFSKITFSTQIFKNIKTVIKAFKLIDVNKTGLIQPCELRKVLETFCLKMKDDEYRK